MRFPAQAARPARVSRPRKREFQIARPLTQPLNRTTTRNTMHRNLLEFAVRVAAG